MIEGHGDDSYLYGNIRMNFSSNIHAHADLSALKSFLAGHLDCIASYPEPSPRRLEALIAADCGLDPSQVLVTAGATEAIYLIAQVFRDRPTFKVFRPTFSEYEDACRIFGYRESDRADLCWLCNPDNPTGRVCDEAFIRTLTGQHRLLVLDQSYEDYTAQPLIHPSLVPAFGNLIQLHSMTKRYAVPGLRLGYVTAASDLVARLRSEMHPWPVNALALQAGEWLLTNRQTVLPDKDLRLAEAVRLRHLLNAIEGIEMGESSTTFMLGTVRPALAAELKDWLAREKGMLIRDASNFQGLTAHHFRIAAQSPEEDDSLVAAVRDFMHR
ncbi:MAG: aminotransferase class I/II-fold pyridoxal phosphate-dependent enzyme [Bacteroidales bacterium]|nr:aminotransferase class I/II-fold pyridoxal phosphate-dependent enzyme [Bacteroidales bacterium]